MTKTVQTEYNRARSNCRGAACFRKLLFAKIAIISKKTKKLFSYLGMFMNCLFLRGKMALRSALRGIRDEKFFLYSLSLIYAYPY
jgi:hypothetical protein